MQVYRQFAELIVGSRLRRIGEKLFFDISKVYKFNRIDFEPGWFPLFYLLSKKEQITVTEVASLLEITNSGASQLINSLVKKGIIQYHNHEQDKRIRFITFTLKGKELLELVTPLWDSIGEATERLLHQGIQSRYLFEALNELEDNLHKESYFERIQSLHTIRSACANTSLGRITPENFNAYKNTYNSLFLRWIIENPLKHEPFNINFVNDIVHHIQTKKVYLYCINIDTLCIGIALFRIEIGSIAEVMLVQFDKKYYMMQLMKQLVAFAIKDLFDTVAIQKIRSCINRKNHDLIQCFTEFGFSLQSLISASESEFDIVELIYTKTKDTCLYE